jgi:hypothetical protein
MAVWFLLHLIAMIVGTRLQGALLYGATDRSLNCSLPVNFNCPFGQIYGFWLVIKLTAEKRTPQFKLFYLTTSLPLLNTYYAVKFFATLFTSLSLMLICYWNETVTKLIALHKVINYFSLYLVHDSRSFESLGLITTDANYSVLFSIFLHLLKEPG